VDTPLRRCHEFASAAARQARRRGGAGGLERFPSALGGAVRKRMNPSGLTIAQREEFLSTTAFGGVGAGAGVPAKIAARISAEVRPYRSDRPRLFGAHKPAPAPSPNAVC